MKKEKDTTKHEKEITDLLEQIREARKAKGLTQLDMAERLEMSQAAYSALELGKVEMSIRQLYTIFEILDMKFKNKSTEQILIGVNEHTIVENTVNIASLSSRVENVETLLTKLATKEDIEKIIKLINEIK